MAVVSDLQTFLSFYVKGVDPPGETLFFPGIARRRPALLTQSVEFDLQPIDSELDGIDVETLGPPDSDAPAANVPAVFADMCGLEDVIVDDDGSGGFAITFVWCTDYPPTALDPSSKSNKRVVPIDLSGQSGVVMAECMVRLREALGDQLSEVEVATALVRVPFEQIATVSAQILKGNL